MQVEHNGTTTVSASYPRFFPTDVDLDEAERSGVSVATVAVTIDYVFERLEALENLFQDFQRQVLRNELRPMAVPPITSIPKPAPEQRPGKQLSLGERFLRFRDRHGLTQCRLAEILGVHMTIVGRLERGERRGVCCETMAAFEKLEASDRVPGFSV